MDWKVRTSLYHDHRLTLKTLNIVHIMAVNYGWCPHSRGEGDQCTKYILLDMTPPPLDINIIYFLFIYQQGSCHDEAWKTSTCVCSTSTDSAVVQVRPLKAEGADDGTNNPSEGANNATSQVRVYLLSYLSSILIDLT